MKKVSKTTLSLLLVIALLFSICAVPAMAEEEKGNFVFIGDSMSFDFTGKNNYYKSVDTYPQQAARAMGYSTGYGEGHFAYEPCRIPGGRITDAYKEYKFKSETKERP